MTILYNRSSEKQKRQQLRKNMTKAEIMLWDKIRDRQLEGYRFRRQYSIANFVVDFYCPQFKLAIEIDGDSHFQKGIIEYDQARQKFIEAAGIKFLRFTNEDVYSNLDGVLEKIRQTLQNLTIYELKEQGK